MKRLDLTKLSRWQIDACGVLILLLIGAGGWTLAFAPLQRHQQEAAARRQLFGEQSQQAKQLAGQIRQTTRKLSDVREELGQVQLTLQPAARVNQRLAEVTETAGRSGLEVSDVRPGRAVIRQRHTIVPIELAGSGSFPAAVQFVGDFHKAFGDSGVATFELAADPARPGTPASFHFRLHWYVEPQTASAGP